MKNERLGITDDHDKHQKHVFSIAQVRMDVTANVRYVDIFQARFELGKE